MLPSPTNAFAKKKEFLTSLKLFLESHSAAFQTPSPSLLQTLHSLLRKGTAVFEQDIDKFLPIDYSSESPTAIASSLLNSDQKERTLLILEAIRPLLSYNLDCPDYAEKLIKALALRTYFVKLVITDLGKEERESLFSLVEYERPERIDVASLKLYNEIGSSILIERAIDEGNLDIISTCIQSLLKSCSKKQKLSDSVLKILEDVEARLKEWLISGEKEAQVSKHYESTLVPSFFKKKVVKTIKELDGEEIMGMYTIVNRGEAFNQSHLRNIMAFSYLKDWLANRYGRPEENSSELRRYAVAYIIRVFDQIMKVYDSVAPIPEVYATEWANFTEAVCCECFSILDLIFQTDNFYLIETMDTLQKFWKRVLKKQQGFSLLYFLELALNHNKTFLLELEAPLKEFFDQHLANNMANEALCLQTLKFLITKRESISLDTTIFQRYFHIPLLILITNPPLYIIYVRQLLPDITNKNNLLFIFNILLDFPLITRLHTLDALLQEKVLLGKPLDWLAHRYSSVVSYLSLQENLQEPKKAQLDLLRELYNEAPSTIKEKTLYNHIESLLRQFFEIAEALSYSEGLLELIKLILGRYEHIFLEKDLNKRIKKRFRNFIEETLEKHPEFIIQLLDNFVEYFSHYMNEEGRDLVMHLIWLLPEIMLSSISLKKSLNALSFQGGLKEPIINQKDWRKTARHYCESMELVLHQLVYSLMLKEEEDHGERDLIDRSETQKKKETISKERIIELVCLLLGALTKISIKYPELKHNTLLIHIKLLEKKEELPMIINNKIMVNLKLLKESAATLILLEAGS